MKGGVTSGIVYPPAIVEISRKFQLRGIGGTSAGAIAAALAAAAEYRRQCGGADADKGFELLGEIPQYLGSDARLFHLFAPDKETASLFGFIVAMFDPKGNVVLKLLKLLTSYTVSAAAGLLPGLLYAISAALLADSDFRRWSLLVAVIVAILGALIGALVGAVFDVLVRIPRNGFGLVTGVDGNNELALSTWLSQKIEEIAGLPSGTPLTFGMLWRAGMPDVGPNEDPPMRRERVIDLRMITTSLTEGRPYEFPLRINAYHFHKDELARYFPEHIITAMEKAKRPGATTYDDLIPMPPISELPIIVATRMSLSFPILLSAVPLYRVDHTPDGKEVPDRVWFSDGGLTSNFPISLFDAPLPAWPTLAINLGSMPTNSKMQTGYIPKRHSAGRLTVFGKIDGLFGFIGAIVNAMQTWNDTLQTKLPGFRDRIYTIQLTSDQGGLNLNMPPQTIADLIELGEDAGKTLVERFDNVSDLTPEAPMRSWGDHRWTRLRTTLSMLCEYLGDLDTTCANPYGDDVSFYDLVDAQDSSTIPRRSPYKIAGGAAGRTKVNDLLHQLANIGQQLQAASEVDDNGPRPHPLLQTRPDLTK